MLTMGLTQRRRILRKCRSSHGKRALAGGRGHGRTDADGRKEWDVGAQFAARRPSCRKRYCEQAIGGMTAGWPPDENWDVNFEVLNALGGVFH